MKSQDKIERTIDKIWDRIEKEESSGELDFLRHAKDVLEWVLDETDMLDYIEDDEE